MSDVSLPAWVKKRDGRVVPFDPDAIGQDLFAAAESLGGADPFLTRELTDGVLHFLATERSDNVPTTEWIAELVVKVVRELRQPRLAQAFASHARPPAAHHATPADVVRRGLEAYSLDAVYSRDLAAAHRDGLLVLTGLNAPRELAAAVLTPREPLASLQTLQLLDAVLEAREGVAGWLALDGTEHYNLEAGAPPLPRLLAPVLAATGLKVRLQLNAAEPPAWARANDAGLGPLFADAVPSDLAHDLEKAVRIVQAVLSLERSRCPFVIDWRLGERDFTGEPARAEALGLLARAALGEYPIVFGFERPSRSCTLGPGLDRLHSYLLLSVGLHLPRLLEHTGVAGNLDLFVRKLASLARVAVSAAVQKRHYLRQSLREVDADRPFLQRGFLLERARVLVTPIGLDAAVRSLMGHGLAEGKAGIDAGRRMMQALGSALAEEGKSRLVDCVLDWPDALPAEALGGSARAQTSAWGRLHAAAGAGTAVVALAVEERVSAEQVVRLLEWAWRETDVCRLRFQPQLHVEPEETLYR
jgi:hypothetical protein